MALTASFEEAYESRSVNITREGFNQNFSFYLCGDFWDNAADDPTYGPDDDIEALKYAYSIVPPSRFMPVYAVPENSIYLTLSSLTLTRMAMDVWKVDVQYSVPTKEDGGGNGAGNSGPQGNDPSWSTDFIQLEFSVTTETIHKTMGWTTNACQRRLGAGSTNVPYPAGKAAPIGITNDGVEGTDVYSRAFDFGIQAYFFPQKLTFAYVRRLYRMATTVNSNIFFGFPAASVLFLEASASGSQYEKVPVNFSFKMRPNFQFKTASPTILVDPNEDDPEKMFDQIYDPYFGDAINGPAPGGSFSGWNVVDYRYTHNVEEKLLLQAPILRTIHQVYGSSNFDRFEL